LFSLFFCDFSKGSFFFNKNKSLLILNVTLLGIHYFNFLNSFRILFLII
jgi:hypothetical protein